MRGAMVHTGSVEVSWLASIKLLIKKWNKLVRGEALRRKKNSSIIIPGSVWLSSQRSNFFIVVYPEPAARRQQCVSWRSALLRHSRATTDQDTMRGVIKRSRKVSMVSSRGSLQVGKNGIHRNRNASGLPRTLALKHGLWKGFLLRHLAISFIILMAMQSILGRSC